MKDDTIYRQAAIEIASGYCHPANIAKELAKLPSAEPEPPEYCLGCPTFRKTQLLIPPRKKGKWLDDCGGVKCSVCGHTIDDPYYVDDYCTKCGSFNGEEVE